MSGLCNTQNPKDKHDCPCHPKSQGWVTPICHFISVYIKLCGSDMSIGWFISDSDILVLQYKCRLLHWHGNKWKALVSLINKLVNLERSNFVLFIKHLMENNNSSRKQNSAGEMPCEDLLQGTFTATTTIKHYKPLICGLL